MKLPGGPLLSLLLCLPALAGWQGHVLEFSWADAEPLRIELPQEAGSLLLARRKQRVLLQPGPGLELAAIGRGPQLYERLSELPQEGYTPGWRRALDGSVLALRGPDLVGGLLVSLHAGGGRLTLTLAPARSDFFPGPEAVRGDVQADSIALRWRADPRAQSYAVYELGDGSAPPELILHCAQTTCLLPGGEGLRRLAVASVRAEGISLPSPISLAAPGARFRYGTFSLSSQEGFRFEDDTRLGFAAGYGDVRVWDLDEGSVHGFLTEGELDGFPPLGSFAYLPWEESQRGLSLQRAPSRFFARIGDRTLAEVRLRAVAEDRLQFEFALSELDLELRLQVLERLAGPLAADAAAAVPDLLAALSSPELESRDAAQQALLALGLPLVPLLADAWREGVEVETEHRLRAIVETLWNR